MTYLTDEEKKEYYFRGQEQLLNFDFDEICRQAVRGITLGKESTKLQDQIILDVANELLERIKRGLEYRVKRGERENLGKEKENCVSPFWRELTLNDIKKPNIINLIHFDDLRDYAKDFHIEEQIEDIIDEYEKEMNDEYGTE